MENKLRVKFNLFDVVIIVLVLAVLAAALMLRNRSTGAAAPGRETQPMRYTVELLERSNNVASCIHVGDNAYRSTDGTYLGTIVDVRSIPHVRMMYSTSEGMYREFDCEESSDVYVTVENNGYCTGKDIVIGSLPIKVGMELAVKGKGFAGLGYVTNLDPMGAAVNEDTSAQTGELETEFMIRFMDSRDFVAENIHVGDRFYDGALGALIGEVQNVEIEPYGETQAADGGTVFALKPGRSNVLVTLKGRCIERDDGYYLDGTTELKVGGVVKVKSNYIEREGAYFDLLSIGK
ncbi:MAG: DUF4330 domain-containing protein [Oscillospiraceae bacterium]|nr:DUF4330 domain-containing protein [Oscillospiraceae bacterium]